MEHICGLNCYSLGCTKRERTMSITDGLIYGRRKDDSMSVVSKIKSLTLSRGERLLRKYDLVSDCGDLTEEGREVLDSILLSEYKDKLIERVTELDKEEKAEKKK